MKYEIGYIYAIWDIEDPTLIYYGSTIDLYKRMYNHKSPANDCSSKQIMERDNYEYAILETFENIDEYDLVEREGWYIRNKQCVNIIVPHRTLAEYRRDNKEKIAAGKSEYYQKNKDKIVEKNAEYRQKNKDKSVENYQKNKDKMAVYSAEYYQKNKDKLAEKFICECGGKFTLQNKMTHEKTQRHINYLCELQ